MKVLACVVFGHEIVSDGDSFFSQGRLFVPTVCTRCKVKGYL
jgi:hypothetical protein